MAASTSASPTREKRAKATDASDVWLAQLDYEHEDERRPQDFVEFLGCFPSKRAACLFGYAREFELNTRDFDGEPDIMESYRAAVALCRDVDFSVDEDVEEFESKVAMARDAFWHEYMLSVWRPLEHSEEDVEQYFYNAVEKEKVEEEVREAEEAGSGAQ